jgi:hypothetical protein
VISKISFQFQPLAPSINLAASRQREANSTAFQTAVNHLLTASDQLDRSANRIKPPPCSPAHSTQLSLLCNPSFKANFLFYKEFSERSTP